MAMMSRPLRTDTCASESERFTSELPAPNETHERILRVLGLTERPLGALEIEGALGLLHDELRSACRWLADHGYIMSTVRIGKVAARSAMTFWQLADKGRHWAREQGALVT